MRKLPYRQVGTLLLLAGAFAALYFFGTAAFVLSVGADNTGAIMMLVFVGMSVGIPLFIGVAALVIVAACFAAFGVARHRAVAGSLVTRTLLLLLVVLFFVTILVVPGLPPLAQLAVQTITVVVAVLLTFLIARETRDRWFTRAFGTLALAPVIGIVVSFALLLVGGRDADAATAYTLSTVGSCSAMLCVAAAGVILLFGRRSQGVEAVSNVSAA